MNLPTRSYNFLRRAGLNTSEDIFQHSDSIYKIRNCGEKSFTEILNAMKNLGYDTSVMEQNNPYNWGCEK